VTAAFLGVERNGLARDTDTDAELLMWRCHGRNGAGVPCGPQIGIGAGSTLFPGRVRRGYMAHSSSSPE
jgi:hypothetical protein